MMNDIESIKNTIINDNCMNILCNIPDNSINCILTDIPYNSVNRKDNGIRNMDKDKADILTFNIEDFLNQCYRVASSTIIIFCGKEQMSQIFKYFADKQNDKKGTVRQLIWQKTNPSPVNGQYVYLSNIENAIWFKKGGGIFNAHCKGTVFKHSCGRTKLHPTEKNHELLKELILDNTNEGDIILDPCCGSGAHCLIAQKNNRNFIGIELDENYFNIAKRRIDNEIKQ